MRHSTQPLMGFLLCGLFTLSAGASPPSSDTTERLKVRAEQSFSDLDVALNPELKKGVEDSPKSDAKTAPGRTQQSQTESANLEARQAPSVSTGNVDATTPSQQELYRRILEEEAEARLRRSEDLRSDENWVEEPIVQVQYLDQAPTTVIIERERPARSRRGRYFGHRLGHWLFLDDSSHRDNRTRRAQRRHHRSNKAKKVRKKRTRRVNRQRRARKRHVREQRRRQRD